MKIITSKLDKNQLKPKEDWFSFDENINSIFFYLISLLLSLAVLVLMITAFYKVSAKTSVFSPESSPTIVIDAGHGGEDGGAVANGITEKDINLSIALKLQAIFDNAGFNTVMTRSDDVSLADESIKTVKGRKTSDIKKRAELLNSSKNNILISIHQNKFEQEKYSGTQVFYSTKNQYSALLAQNIQNTVRNSLQVDNTRETKPTDGSIYILNNTSNIAVLIECGFLSNKAESEKLKTEEYQEQLSVAIYNGFASFLSSYAQKTEQEKQ